MRLLLLLVLPFALAIAQQSRVEKDAAAGYGSIKAADLRIHDTILSSDSLEGRETSYPGQEKAAQYIASQFMKAGLKPIGDNGTYFQHFDLDLTRTDDATNVSVRTESSTQTFSWLKDFVSFGTRDTVLSGSVAFVGFMDSALDSVSQAKLAGKIVVAFVGKRLEARDTAAPAMQRVFRSFRRDPGVLATLVVADERGSSSFEKISSLFRSFGADRGSMSLKGITRQPRAQSLVFFVSSAIANEILRQNGSTMSELRTRAEKDSIFSPRFFERTTMTIQTKVERQDRHSENVVGLLAGSDPELKKQVVVFSAHYDHLGKSADGRIYHGADDDGSGTSMVLDLAQAFTANKVRPKRSILFMTVAGEEKGLLGSSYYVSHPLIPLDQTIADINTDMIGRVDPKHDSLKVVDYTYVIGSDKISTELDSVLHVANAESENLTLDYQYNDENDPNQFYRRSDHFNFARNGIPIVFFFTGVHVDYHQPTDTVDKILFDRMAKIGKLVYYTGWKVANFPRMFTKNGTAGGYR